MRNYHYIKINHNESLFITESAQSKINEILADEDQALFRIRVDGGGCNGMQYNFYIEQHDTRNINNQNSNNNSHYNNQNTDNQVTSEKEELIIITDQEQEPALIVDKMSFKFIKGATLDYQISLIGAKFQITKNPLSSSQCGCGKSFGADFTKLMSQNNKHG